jgi:hypothetical protein
MADIFRDIGQAITAPIGGFIRGATRGLDPGGAEMHDLQKKALRAEYKSRGLRGVIEALRTSGGDIEMAKEVLSDDPQMQKLLAALDPLRGFSDEQKLQARLYGAGVKARPGAQPWETFGLESGPELQDYAAKLRHGKLQSTKAPWEREEYAPAETGGALQNVRPMPQIPLQPVETEPPPLQEIPQRKVQEAHTPQPQITGPPSPYTPAGTPKRIEGLTSRQTDVIGKIPEPKNFEAFKRAYNSISDPEIAEAYFNKWAGKFK